MAKTATLSSGSVLLPDASMSQSGLMLAALVGGFVIWLMLQGKLGNYWSILMGGSTTAPSTTTPSTTTPSTTAPSTTAPSTTAPSTTTPSTTAPSYLVPPMPSIGFPGLKGSLF
jgi:hypothetical protein